MPNWRSELSNSARGLNCGSPVVTSDTPRGAALTHHIKYSARNHSRVGPTGGGGDSTITPPGAGLVKSGNAGNIGCRVAGGAGGCAGSEAGEGPCAGNGALTATGPPKSIGRTSGYGTGAGGGGVCAVNAGAVASKVSKTNRNPLRMAHHPEFVKVARGYCRQRRICQEITPRHAAEPGITGFRPSFPTPQNLAKKNRNQPRSRAGRHGTFNLPIGCRTGMLRP
jgi:hypothetical protein